MTEEFSVFGLAGLAASERESRPDNSGAGGGAGTGEAVQEHRLTNKAIEHVKTILNISHNPEVVWMV